MHTEHAFFGGNTIRVCFGPDECNWYSTIKNNLHNVWDRSIPHKLRGLPRDLTPVQEKKAAAIWAETLHKLPSGNNSHSDYSSGEEDVQVCADLKDMDRCSLTWARESNALVCSYAMAKPLDWLRSHDLSNEYYEGAAPIVQQRVARAGRRLAAWLEELVKEAKIRKVAALRTGGLGRGSARFGGSSNQQVFA